jgi:hypothetical protein
MKGRKHVRKKKQHLITIAIIIIGITAWLFFFRQFTQPIVQLKPTYEEAIRGTLNISLIGTLQLPTRIKITPDNKHMLVAELYGNIWAYARKNSTWVKQQTPFYTVDIKNPEGERGLTGMFFGENNELFLTYQTFEGDDYYDRITRVTYTENNGIITATNPTIIYTAPQPSGQAHQIQDGISFEYQGKQHIMVSLGDAWHAEDAINESIESHGKILLMQADGSNPLGKRPFENPKIQAIGIRNIYNMILLPENIDKKRRILAAENGQHKNDRIWLLELIDFDDSSNKKFKLNWNGTDSGEHWERLKDRNGTEGVIALITPAVGPTSIVLHPGKGIIPQTNTENVSFLLGYFGETLAKDNENKYIMLGVIKNLTTQPKAALTPLIKRADYANGTLGNIVPVEVDTQTGDILFADIMTGELDRAEIT